MCFRNKVPDDAIGRVRVDVVLGQSAEKPVIDLERDPGLHILDVTVSVRTGQVSGRNLNRKSILSIVLWSYYHWIVTSAPRYQLQSHFII